MRTKLIFVALVLAATPAVALEAGLTSNYGTEAGCLLAAGTGQHGTGEATAFTASEIRFEGGLCPYTAATEATNEAGAPTIEVSISCESGHDEAAPGKLQLTENAEAKTLSVVKVSGAGPEGEFPMCAKAQ